MYVKCKPCFSWHSYLDQTRPFQGPTKQKIQLAESEKLTEVYSQNKIGVKKMLAGRGTERKNENAINFMSNKSQRKLHTSLSILNPKI